ncbi:MAG: hypothetical protein Tsb005_03550 [Gammaproteobacteria bacterium]
MSVKQVVISIFIGMLLINISSLAIASLGDSQQKKALTPTDTAILNSLYGFPATPMQDNRQRLEHQIKMYFERQVFPIVPDALRELRHNPSCPGPCCPEHVESLDAPQAHASEIAFALEGEKHCKGPLKRK